MKKKFVLVFLVIFLACGCGENVYSIKNIDSKGENIICFGNSLTVGTGASNGKDYPGLIAKEVNLPVINAGRGGDISLDGLKRINEVLENNPKVVIVEFGGNDFLKRVPVEETITHIDKIVKQLQDAGAIVILVEVKTGAFGDAYLAGFKKIARKRKAVLIANVLKGVLDNPELKYDAIHPNEKGYELMAERILEKLLPLIQANKELTN